MTVLHNNQLFSLDMPFTLYESFKRNNPTLEIEILTLSSSTYQEKKIVPIKDVEDWSIARNLQALAT